MADLSQIVNQHGSAVWRTVYRLVNNQADAEDCFQATWASAVTFARSQEVRNWRAFLIRLATCRAIECLRQRQRESNRLRTLPDSISDRDVTEPRQAAEASELAAHLRDALARLRPQQAQVFCLSAEGLSYREIADQLGVTTENVGVLLRRARVRLRTLLRQYEPAAHVEHAREEVPP
jgi:RNA polymerase sigma-70 factor (ECF subfamily)